MPSSVEELLGAVKEEFSLTAEVSLQYRDEDFNDFFTLSSTSELKDKDTLKVVFMPHTVTLTVVPMESTPDTSDVSSLYECASQSTESDDTVNLSPSPL